MPSIKEVLGSVLIERERVKYPCRYSLETPIIQDQTFYEVESNGIISYYDEPFPENAVFVVKKNADFTEGNGPMVFHALFHDYDNAVQYIMEQEGIYGSEQRINNTFGVAIDGSPYVLSEFNGYDIVPTVFKD